MAIPYNVIQLREVPQIVEQLFECSAKRSNYNSDADIESLPDDHFNYSLSTSKRPLKKQSDFKMVKNSEEEKIMLLKGFRKHFKTPRNIINEVELRNNIEQQVARTGSMSYFEDIQFPIELYIKTSPYVKSLERHHKDLQKAFLMINSRFGQMQFRLVQVLDSPPEEREALLNELRKIVFSQIGEEKDEMECGDAFEEEAENIFIKQAELIKNMESNFVALLSKLRQVEENEVKALKREKRYSYLKISKLHRHFRRKLQFLKSMSFTEGSPNEEIPLNCIKRLESITPVTGQQISSVENGPPKTFWSRLFKL